MLEILPIPILRDNYTWLIKRNDDNGVYIVDPGDAKPVIDVITREYYTVNAILITHSHRDHTGGIDELLTHFECPVIGPRCDKIPQITQFVSEGDAIRLWGETVTTVLETPGHLPEHLCFLIDDAHQSHLMCGDILFSSGCGRNFIGTSAEFHHSLSRIAALPPNTLFYCAHEYTEHNILFAEAIEPSNTDLQQKKRDVHAKRLAQLPSLPSLLGLELLTNPFMRCDHPAVILAAEKYANKKLSKPADVFGVLRAWKDVF